MPHHCIAHGRSRARRTERRHVQVAALAAALLIPAQASAYSYDTTISSPCHESLTGDALRAVRAELSTAPPIEPDGDEEALINDLPFDLDGDLRDLGAASLIIGSRDNDLKGRGPVSLDALAEVHGAPDAQAEHCLRRTGQDEPDGSAAALAECRAFVRRVAVDALSGLDASGVPDPDARTMLAVDLAIRGSVDASLPHFYVRMGQALHALQDGFSHTFRTPDGMRVTVVLNYLDFANGTLEEGRDGPGHKSELDRCDDPDDLRARNRRLAGDASTELLRAALDPSLDADGKAQAFDATLERYLSYEPGCTIDNGWCDAPEAAYPEGRSCGCVIVGGVDRGGWAWLLAAVAASFALRRGRRARLLASVAAIGVAGVSPSLANAQEQAAPPPAPGALGTIEKPAPPAEPGEEPRTEARLVTRDEAKAEKREYDRSPFGLYGAFSAAFDNPSLAGTLAVRLQLGEAWAIGLDGELNPYYGVQARQWRTGTFNGYGTIIRRFPMRFEQVNLRTTGHLGVSVLMMDLYGAPKGTTGLFVGLSPLGVEWKLSRAVYVIVDPINVAVPAPQLTGTPFAYPQYRFTLGVELAP